ncbi:MAG: hypothetical protein N3A72_02640 [bacterium]|nr:hypothetical protein [bacterium]
MSSWKMPPIAKVYEALSAVADQRVNIIGATNAQVLSSTREKVYDIEWSADMQSFSSNDNASYWQGYIGYPIIAVLLKLGKLTYDNKIVGLLANIPWKEINLKFKRDYEKAVAYVLEQIEAKGGNRTEIISEVERIYKQLNELHLQRLQKHRLPPK